MKFRADYERITTAALDGYARTIAAAWKDYQRIAAAARADYERICATAWARAYINDRGAIVSNELPVREFPMPRKGARVALHPACDEWMQGDRYGTVEGFSRPRECRNYGEAATYRARLVRVRLDSGRVRRFHPMNVQEI